MTYHSWIKKWGFAIDRKQKTVRAVFIKTVNREHFKLRKIILYVFSA